MRIRVHLTYYAQILGSGTLEAIGAAGGLGLGLLLDLHHRLLFLAGVHLDWHASVS